MGLGELGAEARRRLGPPPSLAEWPLVSIVVPNRNGAEHLRRLLAGLESHTDYPGLELILVDNASTDESLALARSTPARFPISIVANPHNESFSDACNQGAALASGSLLLFLNNDVEPFEDGWLRELVACLRQREAGLVGATLLQPDERGSYGCTVQHRAIGLHEQDGLLRAELLGRGEEPLGEAFGEDVESPIPGGACMLIGRELFDAVGGFTHGFLYGGEDIDLGFEVLSQDASIVCAGRSLLVHRLGSTRAVERDRERHHEIGRGNRRLLWERWGPRVRREYELDRLAGGGLWVSRGTADPTAPPSRDEILRLGFVLHADCGVNHTGGGSTPQSASVSDTEVERVCAEMEKRGHRYLVLRREEIDDLRGMEYDVAVHLTGPRRYVPKPGQLNVLWNPAGLDAVPVADPRYDLVTDAGPGELIDAVLARAEALGWPTRLTPDRPGPYGKVGTS